MNKNKKNSGRQHTRTPVRSKLVMKHDAIGELVVVTENISDGGVFIELLSTDKPKIGDRVSVQLQDLPIIAPVIPARVVRIDKEGIGLAFIDPSEKQ